MSDAGERADAIPEAAVEALKRESPYGLLDSCARRMLAAAAPFLRAAQPEAGSEETERIVAWLRAQPGGPGALNFRNRANVVADAIEREFVRAAPPEADRAPGEVETDRDV